MDETRDSMGRGQEPVRVEPLSPKRQEDRTILINFVLDKSGSMTSVREATISGFNEFLGDQLREGGQARMTLTLFDTQFHTIAREAPLSQVAPLDATTYRPDGCTALYDAIGHTMRMTDDYVAAHHPDQVLFVVMTDGLENSSREFDRRRIFEMISDRQRRAEYEFIYLGANQDAYLESERIGVAPGHALVWDATPEGAACAMLRVSRNVSGFRRDGRKTVEADAFFGDLEVLGSCDYEDYRRRRAQERSSTGE